MVQMDRISRAKELCCPRVFVGTITVCYTSSILLLGANLSNYITSEGLLLARGYVQIQP